MNIVKGVADLLRRSSAGQTEELSTWQRVDKISAPTPKIRFREVGDEAVLNSLWRKYENATEEVEKRKLLQIFIMHFLHIYDNWEPDNSLKLQDFGENYTGCSFGHPAEILLVLVQEIALLTTSITALQSTPDLLDAFASLNFGVEGIKMLEALTIASRSIYNSKIFIFHEGMQKLTALMKAAVVQLKSLISAFSNNDKTPDYTLEKIGTLQKILVCVVFVICNLIDSSPDKSEKGGSDFTIDCGALMASKSLDKQVGNDTVVISDFKMEWRHRAITSLLEAGGVNWLVELLRLVKRMTLKEQVTEMSLQHLTLKAIHSSLSENPRAQNHFRSIGGLEVLLDGLSLPSGSIQALKDVFIASDERKINDMQIVFQLHTLSLEVLREAIFGNLNNLQFLFENGRVQKFANNLCWPAFMIQEFQHGIMESSMDQKDDLHLLFPEFKENIREILSRTWNQYVVNLCQTLCSFFLASEDVKCCCEQPSVGQTARSLSFVYWELSIKWILKVLRTVYPCIKACYTQNKLPAHLRVLGSTLQHYVLYACKKVFICLPILLEVFRDEGGWEFIFSNNFFYFGFSLDESPVESHRYVDGSKNYGLGYDLHVSCSTLETIQMEVISFVEFAATLDGNMSNLQECSALLDALEQSARNPHIAIVLVKSLHRILQLSCEQTVAAFNKLGAISRILKISCIQSEEFRGTVAPEHKYCEGNMDANVLDLLGAAKKWTQCMEDSFALFIEYLNTNDDVKLSVLQDPLCIDSLFDLFWEECLRKPVLECVLEFLKVLPFMEDAKILKSQLCIKYLEIFTRAKDMENGFAELSIGLLVGIRDVLAIDQVYYQDLFREGECFLHIVSFLNGSLDKKAGEELLLTVLQTLTSLLAGNNASKAAFRSLVGLGYQTLQSLLLDVCQWQPTVELLNSLLDMLVDGDFNNRQNPVIKNDDVVILFFGVLQKSGDMLQHYGLDVFQHLMNVSIVNRASCYRSGLLSFLLGWFSVEDSDDVNWKIAQLIKLIGGYSISGKDIRKIFALLRCEKVSLRPKCCSLLLSSVQAMLKDKGSTAFLDFSGVDSGILIKGPIQWPCNKGFSFSCWVRVESFPLSGLMGLFSFRTEDGRGCSAVFGRNKLVFETFNQKRQCISLPLNLSEKKWQHLCITHSIGRAFSGGSLLRCYVDGDLFSTEKCRYAKIGEVLTCCSIGTKILPIPVGDEDTTSIFSDSICLHGQLGPIYLFADAISHEQVKGVSSLGPSYMYSFLDSEDCLNFNTYVSNIVFDAKDGLASKIICGLNAQASDGQNLFSVSRLHDPTLDKNFPEATIMSGTQLCSRRLLQHIIYCVGGVSVFFPLLTQFGSFEDSESNQLELASLRYITRDRLVAVAIELIASVLDENPANQQQMHLLSGFAIVGFLLRSVPPQLLNLEAAAALKHLLCVVKNSGLSELLAEEVTSSIYLNPHIWIYTDFNVQRELYMSLIQYFENDRNLLTSICRLPQIIDIIHQFYWDKVTGRSAFGCKPLLHTVTGEIIAERPSRDEIQKIRLLLLSLAEMSLRQNIEASDIKALVSFFERSQDMVCIEDVLHMVIRFLSQKPLLVTFLDQVNSLGGCQIFLNLLRRELEPIRLLGLQFIGKLLVGVPSDKKGSKLFNLGMQRAKSISESPIKGNTRIEPIFSAIADRLFNFPQTDHLSAMLFDVLLGGASPKQVLQKYHLPEDERSKKINPSNLSSHFILPQILVLVFNFLSSCGDALARVKIFEDVLNLLASNPSNIEAVMENAWTYWLSNLRRFYVFRNYNSKSLLQGDSLEKCEESLARSLFCSVLVHYTCWIKGGWQHLEETTNSILLLSEQGNHSCHILLRDILEDLVVGLVELSSEDNIFISQPCRDNTLFLVKLVEEVLVHEQGHLLPFPGNILSSDFSHEFLESESQKEIAAAVFEALSEKMKDNHIRIVETVNDRWWTLYDKLWFVLSGMNDRIPSKTIAKSATPVGPSLGQRARGLVESLNIPAAEMAAVVVSGGIGSALSGKTSKYVDKAMLLRGEKCPRIVFRLVILYICHANLERASRCVQLFLSLLPCLLNTDDEQCKNRFQLFIWSLLTVRSQCEMIDDGARFHVISHLIRETVQRGKSMLLKNIQGKEDSSDFGINMKEAGTIHNLIQKECLLSAVVDEEIYVTSLKADRQVQLQEFCMKLEENISTEMSQKLVLEEEVQTNLNLILSADDKRRAAAQLAIDEYQQGVAEKWAHVIRMLVDERGPWSANAFPNSMIKRWKLDKTEDLWRRRLKLKRNYHFSEHLCHPSDISSTEMGNATDVGTSIFGSDVPEKMKHFLLKGIRGITEDGNSETYDIDSNVNDLKIENSSDQVTDQGKDTMEDTSVTARNETNEVLLSVPCVLVATKRKLAGHLAIMHNELHFFGEFLVEGTAGSSIFSQFSSKDPGSNESLGEIHKFKFQKGSILSDGDYHKANFLHHFDNLSENLFLKHQDKVKRHRRWNITKIKAVHWTRYLLRYTAIEIFFNDSVAPAFFNFSSQKDAKDVGTLIVNRRNEAALPKGNIKERNAMISFVDRRVGLEMAENARESWKRREMSNFEYLMVLNTLAGRSYNDLTQYPVFPWVLADYTSEKLDFNKASTFRDLTKPIGALNSKRFEVFEDRYQNFSDPDIPSFYYGSHYSSMGIVLYYLLRLEPFTTLHRNLQGGKFDHADRLFQSIESTYSNCLSNTSDVKELIPEFFYMPEFLVNSNLYHLGVKQDGVPLGDVTLPPWAKGSPEEFVCKNREALESEYVSSNLHHWIDLVFGYKQRGKPAVEAANVFYYLTYEGSVDLDTMDDELQRSAIEDQIANFGQTPIQIFRKKHPRRGTPIPIAHPLCFAPASITLTSMISTTHPSALLFIGVFDSNVLFVNMELVMSVKVWVTTQLQSGGNFTFSSSQEPFFGIGPDVLPSRNISTPMVENIYLGRQNFAILQRSSENFLITCGNWGNSFHITSLNDGKIVQSVRNHKDVVSCVAVSSDGSVLATGSYDTTVMLWDVSPVWTMDKKLRNTQSELPRKNHVIVGSPFHILCGHDDIITCLFVSVEIDVVISGSKDGTCIFHTLREGCYVRSIQHPARCPISKLVASRHGNVVIYSDDDLSLHLYSINGKYIATAESNGRLNCVELSTCGEFVVCAGDQGQIVVRSMHLLETVMKYDGIGKTITALTVTPEECFLAGTRDGSLLVYSIENPQLKKGSVSRTKYKSSAVG